MSTFRKITISITMAMLCVAAPGAHAQDQRELELMQTFLSIMTDYFQIIEATYAISSDPEKSAIMQMQKIQEVYEDRGEKASSADILKQVLKDSDNTSIRNAAYMLLSDTLKETGRTDEALQILRQGLAENIKAAQ